MCDWARQLFSINAVSRWLSPKCIWNIGNFADLLHLTFLVSTNEMLNIRSHFGTPPIFNRCDKRTKKKKEQEKQNLAFFCSSLQLRKQQRLFALKIHGYSKFVVGNLREGHVLVTTTKLAQHDLPAGLPRQAACDSSSAAPVLGVWVWSRHISILYLIFPIHEHKSPPVPPTALSHWQRLFGARELSLMCRSHSLRSIWPLPSRLYRVFLRNDPTPATRMVLGVKVIN